MRDYRKQTGNFGKKDRASHQCVGECEMCPYNADIMTTEHLLQHCQLHDALRRDMWPEPTSLRDDFCGDLGGLRRTAALDRAIGISVQLRTKKSAWTGLHGVCKVCLSEIVSLICNFYLSAAACTILQVDPTPR